MPNNSINFTNQTIFSMARDATTATTMDLMIPGVNDCPGTDVQITNFLFEGFNFDPTQQDPAVANILFSTADSGLMVTGYVTDISMPVSDMTIGAAGITFA